EATDGRAVEAEARLERVLVQPVGRNARVLPDPEEVAEPQVHDLDVVLLRQLQRLLDVAHAHSPLRPRPALNVSLAARPHAAQNPPGPVLSPLARPDAHGLLDVRHEDLPVADAPGLARALDRLDHVRDDRVGDDDLDLHLRDEVDDVRRASVDLALAA